MHRRWALTSLLGLGFVSALLVAGCPSGGDGGGGSLVDGITDSGGNADGGLFGGILGGSNKAPSANIVVSPPSGVKPGDIVTLDASGSSDPDGDALTFAWSQTTGSPAVLSSAVDSVVTFAAPLVVETDVLTFEVAVSDGRGGSNIAVTTFAIEVSGEFAGYPQTSAAYRDSLTSEEAYHLLRRAAFGATPEDVAYAVQRGLNATVDDLLIAKPLPDWIAPLEDSYRENTAKRWMIRLLMGPNPLHERMTMFWHDRFATSKRVIEDYRDRTLGNVHLEMLRSHALGNYREFLQELTLDPLMLIWLDGGNSPKTDPNENYAREFWELFTLGRDVVYTEADIKESARAFTGMSLIRSSDEDTRPIFDIRRHDETTKLIFPERASQPTNYDFEAVIDLTLAQPEAARYVARNLFATFVHDHPTDQLVDELAQYFVASDFNIAALVRKILTSQALFSSESRFNQVTSPVEHYIGVARTLQMHPYAEDSQGYILDQIVRDLANAGQELLNPPGVEGWHENLAWLEDQWIINRAVALGRELEYGPDHREDLPYHLLPPVERWAEREVRGEIVDAMARVFHLPLTDDERDIYIEVLDQGGWKAFQLEDPRYQPQHVFEMIRLMAMDERVIGR